MYKTVKVINKNLQMRYYDEKDTRLMQLKAINW